MAPGTSSKFGAPMFEPAVIRKQMYFIDVEESACVTWLGFSAPLTVARLPGNCAPLVPSLRPWRQISFRSTSGYTSDSLLTKECANCHFAKLETEITMPKIKQSSATKI